MTSATPPLALIFGPVDPSGSDGIPADAVTTAQLGCHSLVAVTALTVQDTAATEDVQPVAPDFLDDQARCLLEDMSVQAIKVGGVYTTETASAIAQVAADYSQVPLVLHLGHRMPLPQDAASQDDAEDLLAATLELLLPQADVVVIESIRLNQWIADGHIDASDLATPMHALQAAGADWVLALGSQQRPGHRAHTLIGPDGQTHTWAWQLPPERNADVGGVLAAALTARLAHGDEMPQAVERAIAYADRTIGISFLPGMGHRVPNRLGDTEPGTSE